MFTGIIFSFDNVSSTVNSLRCYCLENPRNILIIQDEHNTFTVGEKAIILRVQTQAELAFEMND